MRHWHRSALATFGVLLLTGCGSSFSDDQVGSGEKLVSDDLYAIVVPDSAQELNNFDDLISVSWSAYGGTVTARVSQEDATVLSRSGTLTRTPTTVAGVSTERVDVDLRQSAADQPGDRIRYQVAVDRLPLPSESRPTDIEIELVTAAPPSEADVQAFRTAAQRLLDRLQVDA